MPNTYEYDNLFDAFLLFMENDLKKYRSLTFFPNQWKKMTKWSHGRLYSLERDTLYIAVTNLPSINHLNLEHCTWNMGAYFDEVSKVPEVVLEQNIRAHPILECKSFPFYKNLDFMFEKLVTVYLGDVRTFMDREIQHHDIASLVKDYDIQKFVNVIDSVLSRPEDRRTRRICAAFMWILCNYSDDPNFITENTRRIFTYFEERSFGSSLGRTVLNIVLKKVKLAAAGSNTFGLHDSWLLSERLVEQMLVKGDARRLKMLLRHKCPSGFMPEFAPENYDMRQPSDHFWPRRITENAAPVVSYYSFKYHIYLSMLIATHVNASRAKKENLTECVRLIWMSMPTPIIPLTDIQEFFIFLNQNFDYGELWKCLRFFPPEFSTCVYQPRSLQHLCRFTIMQNYRKPKSVESLFIPKQMKSYLRLDFDNEFE